MDRDTKERIDLIPPAPRHLDWFTRSTILFGGILQQFGWAFFSVGLIASWVFVGQSEWRTFFQMGNGSWETITAQAGECVFSGAKENEKAVYRCTFFYSFDGTDRAGTCYCLGENLLKRGSSLEVEVSSRHPERVKVEGCRTAPFTKWVGIVLIFPLIGLGCLIPGVYLNINYLRLLSSGIVAAGKLERKEGTGQTITINNQSYPVYRYRFGFRHQGKDFQTIVKTHLADRVEDDPMERILFDPYRPQKSAVYDAIPNAPAFDQQGNCIPNSYLKSYLFILPALGMLIVFLIFLW